MSPAIAADVSSLEAKLQVLMDELHAFVSRVQRPKTGDTEWRLRMEEIALELQARIDALREEIKLIYEDKRHAISESLEEMTEQFRSYTDQLADEMRSAWEEKRSAFSHSLDEMAVAISAYVDELSETENSKKLKAFYGSMSDRYEIIVNQLRELYKAHQLPKIETEHLKPIKYARNLTHIGLGTSAFVCYHFLLSETQSFIVIGSIFGAFMLLEVLRRFMPGFNDWMVDKLFGAISRPFERHRTNGSTYYAAALLLILLFFSRPAVELAVLVLAFADPAAGLIGSRWGRLKLIGDKSVVGTTAFFLTGFITAVVYQLVFMSGVSFGYALLAGAIISLVSSVAELYGSKLDDNFSIPVACAAIAHLLF